MKELIKNESETSAQGQKASCAEKSDEKKVKNETKM